MAKSPKKSFHTGTVKKTIKIKASKDKVWRKVSNIVGLPTWLVDVKKTVYLSKKKKGIGAIRLITFTDGNQIEEHVVAWDTGKYFTYVATSCFICSRVGWCTFNTQSCFRLPKNRSTTALSQQAPTSPIDDLNP